MAEKRFSFRRSDRVSLLELQFWKRGAAFFLDYQLLTLILLPAIMTLVGFFSKSYPIDTLVDTLDANVYTRSFPYNVVFYFLYFSFFESSRLQASPGKRFFGYKVCDREGNRLTLFTAIVRSFLRLISFVSVAGIFMIDVNKPRQGLHDVICRTLVRKI